jgi:hypothetical protein
LVAAYDSFWRSGFTRSDVHRIAGRAEKPVVMLTALDFGALADATRGATVSPLGTHEDDSKCTSFVPEGWTGGTREE